MYTHIIVSSNQKCYQAVWWPSKETSLGPREKSHPLMMFESGQCNRVRKSNLRPNV